MGTTVAEVLRNKGFNVVTTTPDSTVSQVARLLRSNRIGAVPVIDQNAALVGIISERDIVRGISDTGATVLDSAVTSLMTREVKTCTSTDAIVELMEIMTNQRIRHLPVVEGGTLKGIISIGDVVKQRLAEAHFELEELRKYIASN
jgi:CBS domain-containing protein